MPQSLETDRDWPAVLPRHVSMSAAGLYGRCGRQAAAQLAHAALAIYRREVALRQNRSLQTLERSSEQGVAGIHPTCLSVPVEQNYQRPDDLFGDRCAWGMLRGTQAARPGRGCRR